jgi:ParB family transcriptional regulator, chromosome partitioning protein
MKIVEYRDIPLEQLEIGVSQARVRDVSKNVDDLAASLAKVGLLEPIVVAPVDSGERFEIVTGQRRFLAAKQLNWKTIKAGVMDTKPADDIAKAISLTENMVREDMSQADYIDACTSLFRRYGSIKQVCEELGLPYSKVQKYVKFDQLIPVLKGKVTSGELQMDVALRAQGAATKNGNVDQELAVVLADEMKGMAGAQQRKLERVAKQHVGEDVSIILEEGLKQAKVISMNITISEDASAALDKYATEEGSSKAGAAESLILSGLASRGYYAESE